MTTRAWYHPRHMEIDLADNPPQWLYDEIVTLHGQIARTDDPVLTCLKNHTPMYVYRNQLGRYFARHFPNQPCGHTHHIATISDEHQRQAEYVERAASEHGLDTSLELSTGNGTRLDVAVRGEADTGFEIQRSTLSRRQAKSRTAKSFNAGWLSAWVSDSERDPDWADNVPTIRLTTRGWDTGMPPRGTAKAVISHFTRQRVGLNKWQYKREPRTLTLDELAYRIPAQDVVPVRIGNKGLVTLATPRDAEIVDSCTYPGASHWTPQHETPRHKEATQHYTTECHHPDDEITTSEPRVPQPERAPRCADCDGPLFSPLDRADGVCAGCDGKRARADGHHRPHRACPVCGEPLPAGTVRHFPGCYYQSLQRGDPSGGA